MKKIKHVSSAGVEVDFDLIKAKQQMATNPAPSSVQERQARIDARLRRRMNALGPTRTEIVKAPPPSPPPVEKRPESDTVVDEYDGAELPSEEAPPDAERPKPKPKRRQRAKPSRDSEDNDE